MDDRLLKRLLIVHQIRLVTAISCVLFFFLFQPFDLKSDYI